MLYAVRLFQLLFVLYALGSTLYDLRSVLRFTIYSQSTYCNLYSHDLPPKLYQLLFAFYALRSTLYYLLSKHLLQPLFARSTLCKLYQLLFALYTLRSTLYALQSTLYSLST